MTDSPKAPRDRRAKPRAALEIPATAQLGEEEFTCTIRNVSTQGMALSNIGRAKPGSVLRVVFRLPNSREPIEVAGVVVRTETLASTRAWGLRLVDPPAQAVVAIDDYVSKNRSDRPFSQQGRAAAGDPSRRPNATRGATATVLDDTLKGLYEQAVDEANVQQVKTGWFRRRSKR